MARYSSSKTNAPYYAVLNEVNSQVKYLNGSQSLSQINMHNLLKLIINKKVVNVTSD